MRKDEWLAAEALDMVGDDIFPLANWPRRLAWLSIASDHLDITVLEVAVGSIVYFSLTVDCRRHTCVSFEAPVVISVTHGRSRNNLLME